MELTSYDRAGFSYRAGEAAYVFRSSHFDCRVYRDRRATHFGEWLLLEDCTDHMISM
jgi:hypothetical protein